MTDDQTSRATSQTPDADDFKLTYVKRWRTIVKLPAKYADEIVEALHSTPSASAAADFQPSACPQAEAVREVIKTALVNARCTSRDTTVVTDSTANVLNVVMAALAPIVSTPSAGGEPS